MHFLIILRTLRNEKAKILIITIKLKIKFIDAIIIYKAYFHDKIIKTTIQFFIYKRGKKPFENQTDDRIEDKLPSKRT